MYETILIPVAAFMVYFTALVVKWSFKSRERLGYSLVLFVLTMMVSMFASLVIYVSRPDLSSLEIAAGLSFTVMTAGLVGILYAFISYGAKERNRVPSGNFLNSRGVFRSAVITLVLVNEVLMGWSFSIISGLERVAFLNAHSAWALIDLSVNSYWFTLTMASEMLLTLFYFRKRLTAEMRNMLLFQSILMFFAPPALTEWGLSSAAVYVGSGVMVLLFIYVFDFLYKNREVASFTSSYLVRLMALYSLMMAALFYWGLGNSALLFGLTLMGEMIIYFDAIFHSSSAVQKSGLLWQQRQWWTFSLLALLFVSEYFMAGIIDIIFYGGDFLRTLPSAPLSGQLPNQVAALLFDFISYVSAVTGSSWFYIMMGIEMGALVLFQIRKVKQLETKVRLALVIVAYAVYTVFLPYFFYSSQELQHLPFIGWNMGIGTSGAFAPALLAAIGGTYLVSGVLAFLFGGRQVCSLFCSAALMYQGTFYDSTKSFNRTSHLARKTHRNSLGKIFAFTATAVWVSVFTAILLSYLDSTGLLSVSVFGVDPVVFLYVFYFDFLWYVVFITIPFVGTYGCVTTGICHWGMFNQLIGRMGLFRLKVRDRQECVTCKSKACATACPVGLTALPGKFIDTGEFKNYKCIGVGQCASACPVDNIFFYDARHWLVEKFGGRKLRIIPNVLLAATKRRMKDE